MKGTLLFQERDGKQVPMKGARVVFNPVNGEIGNAPLPAAIVATTGSFTLGTYEAEDGAPEGDYVVTVEWKQRVKPKYDVSGRGEVARGPDKLKGHYSDRNRSPLRATVVPGKDLTILVPPT